MPRHPQLTTGDVAARLDLTRYGVHALDEELKPRRLSNGTRVYSWARVERFALRRDFAAAKREVNGHGSPGRPRSASR